MNDRETLVPVSFSPVSVSQGRILWLFLFLIGFGSLLGSLYFMSFSGPAFSVVPYVGSAPAHGFLYSLWDFLISFFPCIVCGFFASSILGCFVIPAVFLFRGFTIAAGFTALLTCGAGFFVSIAVIFLPALFSTSAVFLQAEDAYYCSRSILRLCRGVSGIRYSYISSDRLLASVILVFVSSGLRMLVIPMLL